MSRFLKQFLMAAAICAAGATARAQDSSSEININGNKVAEIYSRCVVPGTVAASGKGISLAGVRLANSVPTPTEVWKKSTELGNGDGAAVTAAELNDLTGFHNLALRIAASRDATER